eukprot:366114-Chlamydomonas_euryale.AAC.2
MQACEHACTGHEVVHACGHVHARIYVHRHVDRHASVRARAHVTHSCEALPVASAVGPMSTSLRGHGTVKCSFDTTTKSAKNSCSSCTCRAGKAMHVVLMTGACTCHAGKGMRGR